MRIIVTSVLAVICLVALPAGLAAAEGAENVGEAASGVSCTVTGLHICCGSCKRAINQAVADVEGAEGKLEGKTLTVTAVDGERAKAAMAALSAAGFSGTCSQDTCPVSPAIDIPEGATKITGIHNCCGTCEKAIAAALDEVEGADGSTLDGGTLTPPAGADLEAIIAALRRTGLDGTAE